MDCQGYMFIIDKKINLYVKVFTDTWSQKYLETFGLVDPNRSKEWEKQRAC